MESNSGKHILKAQVLYYLCRNGKMEPPHMIQVPHQASEGLRLIDVKRQLTVLRGSAMSNMFSWSYKRIYKNKYIWLDLSDEDVIVPGSGGEYVLKGSEYFDECQDKMMKHVSSQESDTRKPEVLQNKFRGAESWLKQEMPKSSADHCPPMISSLKPEIAESFSRAVHGSRNVKTGGDKKLFPIDNTPAVSMREQQGCTIPDEFLVDNKISSSSDLSDSSAQTVNDIRMLHIKSTVAPVRHCCDAATQTDLNNDGYQESFAKQEKVNSIMSTSSKGLTKDHQELKPNLAEASLLSMISGEQVSEKKLNCKKLRCEAVNCTQSRDKSLNTNIRLKNNSASRVFLQILSCGGLDGKVQKSTSNADTKATKLEKIDNREQSSGQLQGLSQPPSRIGSKPVTPRNHRSPESFRTGTPITYSCELELDNGSNVELFDHSMPPCSGVEEVVTALPSPSNENLSKLASRCSSFSSRRSSRSTDFDSQQDKKIKEVGTTFGTPCKTPGGSPVASGFYKSANASRVVSPARLLSFEGDRQSCAYNLSQRLHTTHVSGNILNQAEQFENSEQISKWKDLSPIKRDIHLSKVGKRL